MNLSPERRDSVRSMYLVPNQSIIETLSCLVLTLLTEH